MDSVLLWLPNRKRMVKILIGHKYCVGHLNKNILSIFSRSSSTINEPNFKIVYNCVHELLNVFENPPQSIHTIN